MEKSVHKTHCCLQYHFELHQQGKYDALHTYYTLGAVYTGKPSWKEIYNAYSEKGAEPFYAAVSNPYLELTLKGAKPRNQEFVAGLCPNAEYVQKHLMAFKTNYIDLDAAQVDANRLDQVLQELGVN